MNMDEIPSPSSRSSRVTAQYLIRHATLRQLQIFEAVARLENFTRAGEELYLTQPTVSAQIRKLSDAIDLPLYEQIGRNIYLTDVGRLVARSCREIIGSLANLEMAVAELKGMRRGRLRLAVITTAKYFAPLALGQFCKRYPDIEINLTVTNRKNLFQRLEENLDDLYITGQVEDGNEDLVAIPFAPNPLVMIAPAGHRLAGKPELAAEEIGAEAFIMREPGSGIRMAVEQWFRDHGIKPRIRLVLDSNEAIKHAVVGELGLAVVSQHALDLEGLNGPLVTLAAPGFPLQRTWNIVYPRGKALSVLAANFLEFLKQHGASCLTLSAYHGLQNTDPHVITER